MRKADIDNINMHLTNVAIQKTTKVGLALPGVRLVTRNTLGVICWCFDCDITCKVPTLPASHVKSHNVQSANPAPRSTTSAAA